MQWCDCVHFVSTACSAVGLRNSGRSESPSGSWAYQVPWSGIDPRVPEGGIPTSRGPHGSASRAEAIERQRVASSMITLSVDGSPMLTYVAVPEGSGPFPGVVVAQAHAGVDALVRSTCDRIAQAGFAVAAPYLYHRLEADCSFDDLMTIERTDPRFEQIVRPLRFKIKDDEVVRDMNAAIEHLRTQALVGDSPVGVTGFCSGGRAAYLMATRNASIRAAACFYPTDIFESFGGGPPPFAGSDRITAHVAGFFGSDDDNPSPADVARIDAELTRLGVEHSFHSYDATEHGFMGPEGGRDRYRERAADDAWSQMLALFNARLQAPMGAT